MSDELIQEGMVGLMSDLNKSKGLHWLNTKLSFYASKQHESFNG
jgi:hypothetical protein